MDLVTLAEDVGGHLRVPEAGLMSEVNTRFQHLSHGHAGHERLLVGLGLRASHVETAAGALRSQGPLSFRPRHPSTCDDARVVYIAKKRRALYHKLVERTMR